MEDEIAVNELSDVASTYAQRYPDTPFIIMGDLNARLGCSNQLDPRITEGSHLTHSRSSLDGKTDRRERLLEDELSSLEFLLLNGRTYSDSPANWTFMH